MHLHTLTLCVLLLQEVDSWSSIDDVDITVDFSFLETPSKAPSSSSPSDESFVSKAKDALKTLLSLEMGTLQRTQRSTLLSSLTTLEQHSKSAAVTTLKNEISESFIRLDEFSATHLTASNHLRLYLQEKDSFSAKQLKLKEIKERESNGQSSFSSDYLED